MNNTVVKVRVDGMDVTIEIKDKKFIKPLCLKSVNGFGSDLKPAFEPILVCRKPLSEKTIAENVIRWGTGALNIDASRIATLVAEGEVTDWCECND